MTDWMSDASCTGMDSTWFFPPEGGTTDPRAIRICAACPVRPSCVDYATVNRVDGYWGSTERERERLRRKRRIRDPDQAEITPEGRARLDALVADYRAQRGVA